MGAGASTATPSVPDSLMEEHQTLLSQGLTEEETHKIMQLVADDFNMIRAEYPHLSDHEINQRLKEKFKKIHHHYGIAPGIYVRNDADIPILFQLSRETPLHWSRVDPGKREKIIATNMQ